MLKIEPARPWLCEIRHMWEGTPSEPAVMKELLNENGEVKNKLLGTPGAVIHHSAETVLCFRIHVSRFTSSFNRPCVTSQYFLY